MARFRPLSLPLLEPPAPDASPKDWERFNDKLWSMQLACCLLPDMRCIAKPALPAFNSLPYPGHLLSKASYTDRHSADLKAVQGQSSAVQSMLRCSACDAIMC